MASTRRFPIEVRRCLHVESVFLLLHTVTDGTEAETTSSFRREDIRHPACPQKLASDVCGLCLPYVPGKPLSRRRLGTCRRHTVTCGLAKQGGLPSVRLQPSHGTPSQLQVTSWGPLCCSVYTSSTPCATDGVSCTGRHLVQSGTQPSCQPRREKHVLNPPSPPEICWGLGSRGPHPPTLRLLLLQPALSVSGLFGPGSRSGSWSFSSHVFPPSFPSIIALFNRSARPQLPVSLFRVSVLFSPPSSDRLEDPASPSRLTSIPLAPSPSSSSWLSGTNPAFQPPANQATMSSRRDHGSGTPSNASNRQNEYFIPRDGIDREVITADICRYLGNDALVRPGTYEV